MRWIGISTREAVGRRVAMDRNWWHTTKLVAAIMVALAAALLVHATIP